MFDPDYDSVLPPFYGFDDDFSPKYDSYDFEGVTDPLMQYEIGWAFYVDEYESIAIQNHKEALHWFQLSGNQSNPKAQYMVALMYFLGQGTNVDYKEAMKWVDRAVEHDLVDAYVLKGLLIDSVSQAKRKTNLESVDCFERAAQLGSIDACVFLGSIYKRFNNSQAAYWYTKAIDNLKKTRAVSNFYINPQCIASYKRSYLQSLRAMELYSESIFFYREAYGEVDIDGYTGSASKENKDKAGFIGWLSWSGLGVEKDSLLAKNLLTYFYKYNVYYYFHGINGNLSPQNISPYDVELLYQQAENGVAYALYYLTKLDNISDDEELQWLLSAANQGIADAMYDVGVLLYKQGAEALGIKWLNKAAENSHQEARVQLFQSYNDGKVKFLRNSENTFPQDYKKAYEYLKTFNIPASISFPVSVARKFNIKDNEADVAYWWHLGAEQGDLESLFFYGSYLYSQRKYNEAISIYEQIVKKKKLDRRRQEYRVAIKSLAELYELV